jgi:hypothetical protein
MTIWKVILKTDLKIKTRGIFAKELQNEYRLMLIEIEASDEYESSLT